MKQGLFEVFGDGHLGRKADDLNVYAERLVQAGFEVLGGSVIATGVFERIVETLTSEDLEAEFEELACPKEVEQINRCLLDGMEIGKPHAIRSSALSERGGTGIYESDFFVPFGDRPDDLERLWKVERRVYASELGPNAEAWRKKMGMPFGMAILIQPVVGSFFSCGFMPTLAGTAYTRYRGIPTFVRTVIGLGTQAVEGKGCIRYSPSDRMSHFEENLSNQESMDAIHSQRRCRMMSCYDRDICASVASNFDAFNGIFEKLHVIRRQMDGDVYLEWAISNQKVIIVQCAPHEEKVSKEISFDIGDKVLLFEGTDVVHSGRASCDRIVYCEYWSAETEEAMKSLNSIMRNYLLIVPQTALSAVPLSPLQFKHFSNASVVCERQAHYSDDDLYVRRAAGLPTVSHSGGRGGAHFSQLCERTDILFIGGEFDPLLIESIDVRRKRIEGGITIMDAPIDVVADANQSIGCVYFDQKRSLKRTYQPFDLHQWSDQLRSCAIRLERLPNCAPMDHFYRVHYAMPSLSDGIEFDPLEPDPVILKEDGIDRIIESVTFVLECGDRYVAGYKWKDGLKEYLSDFLECLRSRKSISV